MCGRCRCSLRPDDVVRACHLPDSSVRHVDIDRYRPSYNVSPGSYLPVLRRESGGTEGYTAAVHCMKWGLIPSFTKKDEKPDHYKMFNARSESICEKASFRRLVPNNRCLVAVEGSASVEFLVDVVFWQVITECGKISRRIIFAVKEIKDGRPLVFAALYDSWKNAEGEVLFTFTILTTDSSSALQWLHDRMPVILGDEVSVDLWLNGPKDTTFSTLLKPFEKPDLAWYPVTPAMNKASFDGPECIKEIPLKTEEQSNPITKFFSKKGTGDDNESNKPVKKPLQESMLKTEPQGDFKEESEAKPSLALSPSKPKGEMETKVDVSSHYLGLDAKVEVKRDYEQFMGDSNFTCEPSRLPPTPTKKSKVKSGTEKQTTLRSYFGRS